MYRAEPLRRRRQQILVSDRQRHACARSFRHFKFRHAVTLTLLLASCDSGRPAAKSPAAVTSDSLPEPALEPVRHFDHHLHIQSSAMAAVFARVQAVASELNEGEPAGEPPQETTAADAIAALDAAGIHGGVVLSNAYMAGMPELVASAEHDAQAESIRVREENLWVADQAAQFPQRLVALCSVNPLRPYAVDEVDRCAGDARVGGLKLHFANSGVDLLDDGHVAQLTALFERLDRHEMPALVHLRTRSPDFGRPDALRFLNQVLARAPRVRLQIAHLAGWGGYDEATDSALGAFVEALDDLPREPPVRTHKPAVVQRERFVFGLGAVVFSPAAAGPDAALAQRVRDANAQLSQRIEQLGAARVVYATDWPSWPPVGVPEARIERNLELLRAELALEPEAIDSILANPGVFFPQ